MVLTRNTFIIEKRKFVLPHAIGYFGVDYKNFEFKVGAGYSKFIILGFEYRFKF
ncbi:hypothetical protein [Caviibacter abscessus]|uniref:hypothetical protein n=1 Tax=Caviibacter abscessus TaxID=1766719 RepID=UPI0012E3C60D|nr:hypothetical protein [Caviibacter abscessus]